MPFAASVPKLPGDSLESTPDGSVLPHGQSRCRSLGFSWLTATTQIGTESEGAAFSLAIIHLPISAGASPTSWPFSRYFGAQDLSCVSFWVAGFQMTRT